MSGLLERVEDQLEELKTKVACVASARKPTENQIEEASEAELDGEEFARFVTRYQRRSMKHLFLVFKSVQAVFSKLHEKHLETAAALQQFNCDKNEFESNHQKLMQQLTEQGFTLFDLLNNTNPLPLWTPEQLQEFATDIVSDETLRILKTEYWDADRRDRAWNSLVGFFEQEQNKRKVTRFLALHRIEQGLLNEVLSKAQQFRRVPTVVDDTELRFRSLPYCAFSQEYGFACPAWFEHPVSWAPDIGIECSPRDMLELFPSACNTDLMKPNYDGTVEFDITRKMLKQWT